MSAAEGAKQAGNGGMKSVKVEEGAHEYRGREVLRQKLH